MDPCVFYHLSAVLLLFVDDVILGAKDNQTVSNIIQLLQDNVDVEDQGDLCDYLGVHVTPIPGGLRLSQPHLIESILHDLGLTFKSKPLSTPMLSSRILHADLDGDNHDNSFNYRAVLGKLNYLENSTRPDLAYSVHQCARFLARPKKTHAQAVKRIGRYLLATRHKGYNLCPKPHRSFECFVDASIAGEWITHLQQQAISDPNTAQSRTGFVIMLAGVPLLWSSKLQTEIALSSTEAKMIALSASAQEIIFLMRLLADAKVHGHDLHVATTKVHCRIFEDNLGTIQIAQEIRIQPWTKHINQKYWHFVSYLKSSLLSIEWIRSGDQLADALTKPLPVDSFCRLNQVICGWPSVIQPPPFNDERECDNTDTQRKPTFTSEAAITPKAQKSKWRSPFDKGSLDSEMRMCVFGFSGTSYKCAKHT